MKLLTQIESEGFLCVLHVLEMRSVLPHQAEGHFSPANAIISLLLSHLKWVSSTVVSSRVQVECSCDHPDVRTHCTSALWPGEGDMPPPASSQHTAGVGMGCRAGPGHWKVIPGCTVLPLMVFLLSSTAGKIIKGRK